MKQKKIPLTVVLDNVRSQHNIGSVFRTGDAFRVEEILLCGITATPPMRNSQGRPGSGRFVQWRYMDERSPPCGAVTGSGYVVYAVEQAEKSISLASEVAKG